MLLVVGGTGERCHPGARRADGGPGAGAVARQRGHAVVGSRVRGAIPSCTGSPSGTLCGSLHRPTAITKRGGETCSWWSGERCHPGARRADGGPGAGAVARQRGHAVVGSRVRGAIPSCTGSPSGTLCGSLHRPTAITKRGGETCSWWSGERCHPGARRADGGPGAGAVARQRGHAVVGSRVRGAIPSCTGSPSGTLCGSLHRPTAITKRGGETCSWWSGERCHPGARRADGGPGAGAVARQRGHAVVGSRVRGAIPSCTGSPSGTLCGSLHRPTAITKRGGETCSWWSGERCHPGARRADGGPGAGAVARQRGHAVVGSRVRGAIPSCTGSPSGTLCGSLHRPTAITKRGGETCSWWSGERCHPGARRADGGPGAGAVARQRGHAVVGSRVRGAIPSCTGSPSGTLCGSLHRPTAITKRGGETCSWWSGERCHPGARRADGGPGAGAVARQRGHAVVGSRVRGAIPSCTGSPSGTLVIVLDLLLP